MTLVSTFKVRSARRERRRRNSAALSRWSWSLSPGRLNQGARVTQEPSTAWPFTRSIDKCHQKQRGIRHGTASSMQETKEKERKWFRGGHLRNSCGFPLKMAPSKFVWILPFSCLPPWQRGKLE
jgi:hypothetical protein